MRPSNSEIKVQLLALARQVDSTDAGTAERLLDLGEAVEGGPSRDAWASVGIDRLVNSDRLMLPSEEKFRRVIDIMEVIRNALVIVPLVATWLGIAGAVTAYRQLLVAQPDQAARPFLFLWEQSFFGYGNWLTLSHLARLDVGLLLLVLGLTVTVYAANLVQENRLARRTEAFRNQARYVLGNAALALADFRPREAAEMMASFEQMSRRLLDAIDGERARLEQLRQQREAEMADITNFAKAFSGSAEQIEAAYGILAAASNNLSASVQKLWEPVDALNNQIGDLIVDARAAARGVDTLIVDERKMALELQTAISAIKLGAERLSEASQKATAAMSDVVRFADQLRQDQGDMLQALANERTAQANLTRSVVEASTGVEDAIQQITLMSREAHAIAVDLADVGQQLHSTPEQLRQHLKAVIDEHKGTAADIGNARAALRSDAQQVVGILEAAEPILRSLADHAEALNRTTAAFSVGSGTSAQSSESDGDGRRPRKR